MILDLFSAIFTADNFFGSGANLTGVASSLVFNLKNISNYTADFIRIGDFRIENISNHSNFPLSNFRLENVSNFSNAPFSNFRLENVSNFSNAPFSNFRLENVSNDTLRISGNASVSLWNITRQEFTMIVPRNINDLVRIGYLNDSLTNWTYDKFSIGGSAAIYGSLNATFINASEIRQRNNLVQTVESAFNVANNATNYTVNYPNIDLNTLDDFNVANNISNNTIGRAELDNGTVIRTGNLTTLNTLDNYIRTADFNLGNVSNDTLKISQNSTVSLWNKTGRANLTLNLAEALILGNVNITGLNNVSANYFTGEIACGGIRFNICVFLYA